LGQVTKQDTSTTDINQQIDKITEHKTTTTGLKRRWSSLCALYLLRNGQKKRVKCEPLHYLGANTHSCP